MIRLCAWHEKYFGYRLEMGVKEPFEDTTVTHGMCDACRDLEAHWTGGANTSNRSKGTSEGPEGS